MTKGRLPWPCVSVRLVAGPGFAPVWSQSHPRICCAFLKPGGIREGLESLFPNRYRLTHSRREVGTRVCDNTGTELAFGSSVHVPVMMAVDRSFATRVAENKLHRRTKWRRGRCCMKPGPDGGRRQAAAQVLCLLVPTARVKSSRWAGQDLSKRWFEAKTSTLTVRPVSPRDTLCSGSLGRLAAWSGDIVAGRVCVGGRRSWGSCKLARVSLVCCCTRTAR